jgi:hypothetical protein
MDRLEEALFADGVNRKYQLYVASGVNKTLIAMPAEIWQQKLDPGRTGSVTVEEYLDCGFPKPLKDQYKEQLLKVYECCVFGSQYLPAIVDKTNYEVLLELGPYAAEILPNHFDCGTNKITML